MTLDPKLLEILACPVDRSPVTLADGKLVCPACGRRYPIVDGIPAMLAERAELPESR